MKKLLIILFLFLCVFAVNGEIINLPDDLGAGEFYLIEFDVKTEKISRPVTDFKIKLEKDNNINFTFVSDYDGIIRILINNEFIKKYSQKISYEKRDGAKIQLISRKVNPVTEKDMSINSNDLDFISGKSRNETELKTTFKERTEKFREYLPSVFVAHSIKPEKDRGYLISLPGEKSDAEIFILSYQLKVEINSSVFNELKSISVPGSVLKDDLEKIYIHPNLKKKESSIEIRWLDFNHFKRITKPDFEIYYTKDDDKYIFDFLDVVEKTNTYLSRILKQNKRHIRFIMMSDSELKNNFFLIGTDTEIVAPITWMDNIVLKVAGMNAEKISYFMAFSYILMNSLRDIKYFETDHPKWASIGLLTYLNLEGYQEIFNDNVLEKRMGIKDKSDGKTDIREWGNVNFKDKNDDDDSKEEKEEDEKGKKEKEYLSAAIKFWKSLTEEYGEDIVSSFLNELNNLNMESATEKAPEIILQNLIKEKGSQKQLNFLF